MIPEQQSSYKQIFKATTLFGGVQVFTIIISIIRSKFIAILLGPTGMGIAGLLNSSTGFIAALTNFGLERSAVKNIAEANGSNDKRRIAKVVAVLRKLVWYTGILGAIVTLVFSSYLSELAFGNRDYTGAFIFLSITLLINQITVGQGVVLRGMRQLKLLAKSSLLGSISGLVFSVPIYYIWGLKGIVPAIIISSISTLVLTFYFSRKVAIEPAKVIKTDFLSEGKNMLSMGFILSLSSLIALGLSYFIRIYIRLIGSIDDVGFYNAGFAIVNTYFGVLFVSLTTDYYPRLAGIAHDNTKARVLMNQQSEMSVLILAPILTVFLVFINAIVLLLYSEKFLPINIMILWAALGIYFKAASWSLGVIFISKGEVKTLFWSELASNLVVLVLNILGYKYFQLEGLGISFMLGFIYSFLQTYLIVHYKYRFRFTYEFYKIFIIQLILGLGCFLIVLLAPNPSHYIYGCAIILVSICFTLWELDKRIDIKRFFNKM